MTRTSRISALGQLRRLERGRVNVGSGQFSGSGAHRFHASHPRSAGAGAGSQEFLAGEKPRPRFERGDPRLGAEPSTRPLMFRVAAFGAS